MTCVKRLKAMKAKLEENASIILSSLDDYDNKKMDITISMDNISVTVPLCANVYECLISMINTEIEDEGGVSML